MEKQRVSPGLYRVYWKTGGASLASIGMGADGEMWFAPTNWIAPDNHVHWECIKSYVKLDIEKEPSKTTETTLSGAKITQNIEDVVDNKVSVDRAEWLKSKMKDFETKHGIFDSGILNQFMTFVLSGGKKFPYIEGSKLIFDIGDKATRAVIHEYGRASVFHGHGSEEYIGEKCNKLLFEIAKFQKEK